MFKFQTFASAGMLFILSGLVLAAPTPGVSSAGTESIIASIPIVTSESAASLASVDPVLVTASSDDGNRPENTLDGDLSTRWSAEGRGEWVHFDMGQARSLQGVDIAFYQGDSRVAYFDIQVSDDGNTWKWLRMGQSSGETNEPEHYGFPTVEARHLRLVGQGNSSNEWNSLTLVEIETSDGEDSTPSHVPVTASADDGNVPENTLDGSLSTRWSAHGPGQWIAYDLGESLTVDAVDIAFFHGATRTTYFDVELSNDGETWEQVFSGSSSGRSDGLELFTLPSTTARYVRIIGQGNSVNNWNSLTQVQVITEAELAESQSLISSATVVASADDGAGSVATNTIDGSLNTRWSALGEGEWVQYDFSKAVSISAVDIAFHRGSERRTWFAVESSQDGATWTRIREATSSGVVDQLERFLLPRTLETRYLRIVGYGNDSNAWTSLSEVQIPAGVGPVVASADDGAGNVATHTVDGDLATRWSAEGDGQWIRYDLGQRVLVSGVDIAFFLGDSRRTSFDIELSDNARNWRRVLSATSSGGTLEPEQFSFAPANARYLRIIGRGNSDNDWISLTQVRPRAHATVEDIDFSDRVFSPSTLHLTWCNKPTESVRVQWLSENADQEDDSRRRIGFRREGDSDWSVAGVVQRSFPVVEAVRRSGFSAQPDLYHADLTGLEPGTTYEFVVLPYREIYRFETPPARLTQTLRFVAGGDVGISSRGHQMSQTAATTDPLFAALGGDLSYADGQRTDEKIRWLQDWSEHMRTEENRLIPLLSTIGNHEVQGGFTDTQRSWEEMLDRSPFFMTLLGCQFDRTSYGAMDFGDYLSLLLLDTNHLSPVRGTQTDWLSQAIQTRQDTAFIVPIYHVPAWPGNRDPGAGVSRRVREHWSPLFEQARLGVAFEHHDHVYKRTWPMRANERDDARGVTYIGDGAWGRSVRSAQNRSYTRVVAEENHILVVDLLTNGEINVEAIKPDGGRVDWVQLNGRGGQ